MYLIQAFVGVIEATILWLLLIVPLLVFATTKKQSRMKNSFIAFLIILAIGITAALAKIYLSAILSSRQSLRHDSLRNGNGIRRTR